MTATLVEQFKDKQVLLWQDKNLYHSCKRMQLGFGVDLISLLEDCIDEFDVLIINRFRDHVNPTETRAFIKKITEMEICKNKQFIFLFSVLKDSYDIKINDFIELGDTILDCSNNIYVLSKIDGCSILETLYNLKNLEDNSIVYLNEHKSGTKTTLCQKDSHI